MPEIITRDECEQRSRPRNHYEPGDAAIEAFAYTAAVLYRAMRIMASELSPQVALDHAVVEYRCERPLADAQREIDAELEEAARKNPK